MIATLDDIVMVVWTEQPCMDALVQLRHVLEHVAARYGRGSSLHVLSRQRELPEKRVRDEMGRVTQDFADRSIASCLVLNGDGFWASAMRGVATSLHFLGSQRRHFKLRVCANIEQAASWLPTAHAQGGGHSVDARDLERALRELCGQRVAPVPRRSWWRV